MVPLNGTRALQEQLDENCLLYTESGQQWQKVRNLWCLSRLLVAPTFSILDGTSKYLMVLQTRRDHQGQRAMRYCSRHVLMRMGPGIWRRLLDISTIMSLKA